MVKRALSMQDLGSAIDHSAASDGSTIEKDDASTSPETETPPLSLRRSKSMNALDGGESDAEEPSGRLPSIATLCLSNKSLAHVHGLEVLKRGAQESSSGGGMTSLPRSLSNSSLSQLVEQEEDLGAASALMELSNAGKKDAADTQTRPGKSEAQPRFARAGSAPKAPVVSLPSLRELLGTASGMPAAALMGMNSPSLFGHPQGSLHWDERTAAMLGAQAYQQLASKGQGEGAAHRSASQMTSTAARSPQSSASTGAGEDADGDGKHNKYCHFCQHVKVKRATSMLACENTECARRFCEHCLKTHLSNVIPSDGKGINEPVDGKWLCPICRKVCCCAIQSCEKNHRHCKAYRYRQRRAEQAAKRTMASESSRAKDTPAGGMPPGSAGGMPGMLAPDAHLLGHPAVAQQQHWAHAAFGAHSAAFSASQVAAAQATQTMHSAAHHRAALKNLGCMPVALAPSMMQHMQLPQLQSQLQGARGMGWTGPASGEGFVGVQGMNVAVVSGPEGLRPMGMPSGPSYMHFL